MKFMRTILSAFAAMLGLLACTSNAVIDLAGEWKVETINGNVVPETLKEPSLSFNMSDMTFSGVTGVNIYNGGFKIDNGGVTFSDGPMTKMMADSVSMAVEDSYMKAIASVKGASVDNGTLTLKDGNGNAVMTLKKM